MGIGFSELSGLSGEVFSPKTLTPLGFPNIFISECPTAPAHGCYARDTPYMLPEMLFDFLLIKHPIGSLSIPRVM